VINRLRMMLSIQTCASTAGRCDAVVCNPPYFPPGSSRANGNLPTHAERRLAQYESTAGYGVH